MSDRVFESPDHPTLERPLRELVEQVPDLLAVAGVDGFFRWLSPQWEKTLGWTLEELKSRPFMEFVLPADRDRTLGEVARLEQGLRAIQFENRYLCKDGSYRWLQWNTTPTDDGVLYCSARDVTDRKVDEQKLQERTHLLEMAERFAGMGHWRVDLSSSAGPFWSPQVYAIHGRDPSYVPTLETAIEAYHPDDREMVGAAVQAAIEEKKPFNFEARIVQPSGSVRFVASHGEAEVNSDGEVMAIFGVFRDLTEEKEMREALLHSERLVSLGTLSAGIAHEINNPLGYLSGNVELAAEAVERVRDRLPTDEADELDEMLGNALTGVHRIRKIVEGMGSFSRLREQDRAPTDLRRVVRAALEITGHEVRSRAQLETKLDTVPQVLVDENQIVQVLVNLLLNACQAIPPGNALTHRVEVSLRSDGPDAVVRISDTGPGVPAEIKSRIFDPFFTTKPVGAGTGLGLSIAQTILMGHGGSLAIQDRPGGGATFIMRLPMLDAPSVPGTDEVVAADVPRVLVVDDEPQIISYLQRALRNDYRVITASTGREALEAIERDPDFVAVLCDLMMPDLTGMEVYDALRETGSPLCERFIVITGGAFTPKAESFLEREPVPVLRKPLELKGLREAVALAASEAETELEEGVA